MPSSFYISPLWYFIPVFWEGGGGGTGQVRPHLLDRFLWRITYTHIFLLISPTSTFSDKLTRSPHPTLLGYRHPNLYDCFSRKKLGSLRFSHPPIIMGGTPPFPPCGSIAIGVGFYPNTSITAPSGILPVPNKLSPHIFQGIPYQVRQA